MKPSEREELIKNGKKVRWCDTEGNEGVYMGQTNKENVPHGYGKFVHKTGDEVQGIWEDGHKKGFFEFNFIDQSNSKGYIKEERPIGQWEIQNCHGELYTGKFQNWM